MVAYKKHNSLHFKDFTGALVKFAGREQIPEIVTMIREDTFGRSIDPVLGVCVRLSKPEEINGLVAECFNDFHKGRHTAKVFKDLGPAAESHVVSSLEYCDARGLIPALEVVATIGTEKSLPRLESLAKEAARLKNASVANAIKVAKTAIQSRTPK